MSAVGWGQIAGFALLLTALTPLLGRWLVAVFSSPPTRLERRLVVALLNFVPALLLGPVVQGLTDQLF